MAGAVQEVRPTLRNMAVVVVAAAPRYMAVMAAVLYMAQAVGEVLGAVMAALTVDMAVPGVAIQQAMPPIVGLVQATPATPVRVMILAAVTVVVEPVERLQV